MSHTTLLHKGTEIFSNFFQKMKRTRKEAGPSEIESSNASAYHINDPPINSAQWWYYRIQKDLSESRVGKLRRLQQPLCLIRVLHG